MADTNNHCIRKITVGGEVTTIAESGTEGHHDAIGTAAQFEYPNGVAVDGTGNLYVADRSNDRIRKITPGGEVTTITGSGSQGHHDGTGTEAEFDGPSSVTVDSSGNLYVVEYTGNRIRKITITTSEAGVVTAAVTTLAGSGSQGYTDATGTAAQFDGPLGVAVDSSGNLYVADTDNHRIRKIEYK